MVEMRPQDQFLGLSLIALPDCLELFLQIGELDYFSWAELLVALGIMVF